MNLSPLDFVRSQQLGGYPLRETEDGRVFLSWQGRPGARGNRPYERAEPKPMSKKARRHAARRSRAT